MGRLQIILKQWPSADRLARAMGVSPSAFRKWLKGEAEPSRERLVSLAKAAGVGIGWLVSGEGAEPDFREPGAAADPVGRDLATLARFVKLPRRVTTAAAGGGATQPDWAQSEFIALRQDWIQRAVNVDPSNVGLEIAVGDSMAPTIHDGDLLLVDAAARELGQFGIYVVEVAGGRLVKRIQRKIDGTVVLISDNPSYEPDYLHPVNLGEIKVIGRVVWIGGMV